SSANSRKASVATEILLTKADEVSDDGACAAGSRRMQSRAGCRYATPEAHQRRSASAGVLLRSIALERAVGPTSGARGRRYPPNEVRAASLEGLLATAASPARMKTRSA